MGRNDAGTPGSERITNGGMKRYGFWLWIQAASET
jgi:hypothetical protein